MSELRTTKNVRIPSACVVNGVVCRFSDKDTANCNGYNGLQITKPGETCHDFSSPEDVS